MISFASTHRRRRLRRGRRGPRRPARARRPRRDLRPGLRARPPGAAWPELGPEAAAAAGRAAWRWASASPARAAPPAPGRTAGRPRRPPRRASRTAPSFAAAGRRAAELLGRRRGRADARQRAPAELVELLSATPPSTGRVDVAARRLPRHAAPASRRGRVGQIVAGDAAGDPAELAGARGPGHGRDADGPDRRWATAASALMEVYRVPPAGVLARADRARPRGRAAAAAPCSTASTTAERRAHRDGPRRRSGSRRCSSSLASACRPGGWPTGTTATPTRTGWRRSPPRSPGATVKVRCPGPLGRLFETWDTVEGSVRFDADGEPADDTQLRDDVVRGARRARRGPRAEPSSRASSARRLRAARARCALAHAVDVVTHEAWHLRGIMDEARDGVPLAADDGRDGAAARRDPGGAGLARLELETGSR